VLKAKTNFSLQNVVNPDNMLSGFAAITLLWRVRHLYIALHQGTDSAPTQFSASTRYCNPILFLPSSYPSCNIATHPTHRDHPISTVPPPTRHDDPKDPSPHSSLLESQPIPGGTTPSQKAGEPIIIPHGFPSSSQITNFAQIAPQATSATLAPVHEIFDRAPLDPTPLLSVEASHVSCQSSLPPDKPTVEMPTKQMGETSQTPAATSLTFSHLGPLPVSVTPSNVPHPPSVSVQQLGDFLNILSLTSSALTLFHSLASHAPQDIAAPYVALDITEISSSTHHMPQSIPNISATPQASDGEATVLPTIVSDSDSLPIMMSAPRGSLIPSVPPSSMESALVHPDHVSRPLGPTPLTFTVPHRQITPHVSSVLDVHVTTGVGSRVRHGYDETRDLNAPVPIEVSLHADQSRPSTDDVARDPLRPKLHRQDQY
jgi:hypothetical protein